MHKDFFRKLRIFDGGTGQELINRGLIPQKISGLLQHY